MASSVLDPFLQEKGSLREMSGPGARRRLNECEHAVRDGHFRTGKHW